MSREKGSRAKNTQGNCTFFHNFERLVRWVVVPGVFHGRSVAAATGPVGGGVSDRDGHVLRCADGAITRVERVAGLGVGVEREPTQWRCTSSDGVE